MTTAAEFAASDAFLLAPVAYSVIDLDGHQVASNQAFRELFRYPEGLVAVDAITHPDDRERTAAYLATLRDGSRDRVVIDKRYVRPDGSVFWGRLMASAGRDAAGQVAFFVGVIEDLTEQMEALAQIEKASAAKSDVVARVSHDLRTPLHAIHGLAELLGYADIDDRHRSFADAIQQEADSLRTLVDDLLDLSRMEAGHLELRAERFDLADCLDKVVSLVGHRAADKGIEISLDLAQLSERALTGDPGRVRQIFTNLTDNAVKFTDEGTVTVAARSNDGSLTVEIRDTGTGIATADLDLIFEPFGRIRSETAGTGLGLAITRDLVEMMGGSIAVESTPGVGSTFSVTLPTGEVAPASAATAEPATSRMDDGPAPHVLVVEDSPVNQILAAGQLDRLGCTHRVVATGTEALRTLEAEHFDLVLMDWHLPDIDGLETTRRWRLREPAVGPGRIPIVAVTARAMTGDAERCIEAGMDGFVAKPVGLDDLARVIREHLRRHDDPEPESDVSNAERTLAALLADLGDADLVRTLVDTFLGELGRRRDALRSAASTGDADEIRRVAHTLKSTSATVGAEALRELMASIEHAAAAGEHRFPALGDELENLIVHTTSELSSTLDHILTNERRSEG